MMTLMRQSALTFVVAAAISTFGTVSAVHAASKAVAVMPGSQDSVAASLIDEMVDRQFTLTGQTSDTLQFDRPVDNVALYPALGGTPGDLPRARVTMTLVPAGESVRVAAKMVIVKNPGKAGEEIAKASDLGADPGVERMLTGAHDTLIARAKSNDEHVAFADTNRR